jgi:zinc/manganese transport system permease protein
MLDTILFMKWPLIACLILPWLLVYLGLHIVQRQVIFVDLALAQVAALGVCVALLLGYDAHEWQSYAASLVFTMVGAVLLTLTRTKNPLVPQEALIGTVYVLSAALAILLLNFSPHGKEELQRSLVGELLVVDRWEILKTFGLFLVVGVVHYLYRRQFLAISESPEKAAAAGIAVRWWDFIFYVLFGLVVMTFVHIGGVLLVFTYLIIPALCAGCLVKSLVARFFVGWAIATAGSMASLLVTAKVDLPIGAAIVCGLGSCLVLTLIVSALLPKRQAG